MIPTRPARPRPLQILATGIATFLALASASEAAEWNGSFDNDWNNGLNWNGGVVPAGTDADIFTVGGNIPTISANIISTPTDIRVGQRRTQTAPGFGQLNHTAGTATTGGGNWMTVGAGLDTVGIYNLADTNSSGGKLTGYGTGSGSMTATDKLWVGGTDNESGGRGLVNINTTGTLAIGNDLYIGANAGNGVVNLDAGTLNRTGGWTVIGRTNGSGTLNMSGGTYTGTGETLLGIDLNSKGTLNLTGGNFTNGGNLVFGRNQGIGVGVISGTANLTSNGEVFVGLNANSTGTLTMTGGTMTINNWLNVGRDDGVGTVSMSGGTMTVQEEARIGWQGATGQGNLIMTGSGVLNAKNVAIGENGAKGVGTVNGANARISATEQLFVGNNAGSKGTLTVSAGTVQSGSWMAVGREGSTGVLNINGTGVVRQGLTDANSYFELTNANAGGSATVNLDSGGLLSVNGVRISGGAAATATFNFNGGTLRGQKDDGDFLPGAITTANVRNGGAIVDSGGFRVTMAKALTHSAIAGDNATDGGLVKVGNGVLTLGGVNTYTGKTVVNGGILAIAGTGSILNNPAGITVNGTGTQMTYPYADGQTRSGALALTGLTTDPLGTTPIILNNGQLIHNGSGDGTQVADSHAYTVQDVTAASGLATFSNQPFFGSQALTIGNLTRTLGATVEFKSNFGTLGNVGDNGQVKLTNLNGAAFTGNDATGMVGGWAIAFNGDGAPWDSYWASYDAATGMKAYTGVYTAAVTGGTAADNVKLTAGETLNANTTVNSLIVQNNQLNIAAGVTLKVNSGGVIVTYGDTDHINGGNLTTGLASGELFVHIYDGAYDQGTGRFRLNTNIVDNGATSTKLVKSGTGTLRLVGASSYTGGTFVNSGSLQIRNAGALGTGSVNVAPGAQLQLGPTLGANVANNITLNGVSPGGALVGGMDSGNVTNTLSGTLTLAATSNVTTDWSDKTLTLAGQITGPGGLIVGLRGTQQGSRVVLSNATNNYLGDTTIETRADGDKPTLIAGAANIIPSGAGKGNLVVNGNFDMQTFSQSINGLSGSGNVFSQSGAALTVGNNNASSFFNGNIASSNGTGFTLTKVGNGTLTLGGTGDNGFLDLVASGGTTVLAKVGNGARSASSVSVLNGATVRNEISPTAAGDTQVFGGITNAGTVDVNGFNLAIGGSISGTGIVTNTANAAGTLTLGVNNNGSQSFDGVIQDGAGSVALVKTGTTTQTLTGINTFTGGTTIQGGTLLVNGSIAGITTVASGGTLGGSGTVGAVTVLGTIAPGATLGTLKTGDLAFRNGSTLSLDLNGTGALADQLAVTGSVSLNGTIALTLSLGYDPVDSTDSFTLINNDGAEAITGSGLFAYQGSVLTNGAFFTVNSNSFLQTFQINYASGDGNDVRLLAVPEPGSLGMLGLAGFLLAARRRRK